MIQFAQAAGPSLLERPEAIEGLQRRAMAVMSLLRDPDRSLLDQLRAFMAVATGYFANLPLPNPAIQMMGITATADELSAAAMALALELLGNASPDRETASEP